MKFIAYYRVSTDGQARSGLGLEAQQASVAKFVEVRDAKLVGSYTEVESGKSAMRAELAKALLACRVHGATLLIAKLDRLSRNVEFIANLMNQRDVKFIACDMPDADTFRLHLEAVIAEEERRRISQRTKDALAAAKARGVLLGGAREGSGFRSRDLATKAGTASAAARARKSKKYAATTMEFVTRARSGGKTALRDIAQALNDAGHPAPRGGLWSAIQVQRVIDKAKPPLPDQG